MALKIDVENKSMVSKEIKHKIAENIKYNYTLFGSTDHFYFVSFDFKINKDKIHEIKNNNTSLVWQDSKCEHNMRIEKAITVDGSIKDCLQLGGNKGPIQVKACDVFTKGKGIFTKFNIFLLTIHDNNINIKSDITYTEIDNGTENIEYNTCVSNENTFEYEVDKWYSVAISLCNVKGAPLVRIYEAGSDIDVANFDDRRALYNNYGTKSNITVSETRTTLDETMSITPYEYKVNDIFKILDHESFKYDYENDTGSYKNDLGLSCEYYDKKLQNGGIRQYYNLKIADHTIYGYRIVKDKDGFVVKCKTFYSLNDDNSRYVDTDCTITDKRIPKNLISRFLMFVYYGPDTDVIVLDKEKVNYSDISNYNITYYTDNHDGRIIAEGISVDSFAKFTAHFIDDRYLSFYIYSANTTILGLYDSYREIYIYRTQISGYVNKNKKYQNVISYGNNPIPNIKFSINRILTNNMISSLNYMSPECKVVVNYDENYKPSLQSLDSCMYCMDDNIIFIRDKYGIPNPIFINED